MPPHELDVPQRGSQDDVRAAAPLDEVARHLRPVARHPLGRGRLVIDVAGVDVGAALEEQARHRHRAREVERRLAVAAARPHLRRVGVEQRNESIRHPQPRRRVDVHPGAALDQVGSEVAVVVEDPEATGPPVAPGVDVGAGGEEEVDDLAVATVHRGEQGRGAEVAARHRLVET